jgi:hypothetical protein
VNFNYPIAQPRFGTRESEIRALVERMSWPREDAVRLQRRQAKARNEMLLLVDLLASHVPSIEFAVRPHPFEGIDDLLKLTKRHPNVVFAGNSPIQDWVVSSDVVLQRGCTTAIEAWLAGSRPVSPSWVDEDRGENIADRMSLEIGNRSDLLEICALLGESGVLPSKVLDHQPSQQDVDRVVGWVGHCDGGAARRVANVLQEVGQESQTRNRRQRGLDEIFRAAVPTRVKRLGRTKRVAALWDNAKAVRRSLILRDAEVVALVGRDLKLSRRRGFYWRSTKDL